MMTSLPTFYQAYNADKENLFGFLFLCVSGKLFGLLDICHINTVPKKILYCFLGPGKLIFLDSVWKSCKMLKKFHDDHLSSQQIPFQIYI